MSGPPLIVLRRGRAWRLRVLEWKDEGGNVIDPTGYTWSLVATTRPPLDVEGSVAGGVVTFALSSSDTNALTPARNIDYAVKATPDGGGDPNYVLEGRATVERSAL